MGRAKWQRTVLLSGTPSVGKTNFLRYARERGITTLSLVKENEDDLGLDFHRVGDLWEAFTKRGDARFLEWAKHLKLGIIEWSYPMSCFPLVAKIHYAGISAWWMRGEEHVARLNHERCGKSLLAFDEQMDGLRTYGDMLSRFYHGHCIERLRSDNTYLSNEKSWR
jgi:hypothetical protein